MDYRQPFFIPALFEFTEIQFKTLSRFINYFGLVLPTEGDSNEESQTFNLYEH